MGKTIILVLFGNCTTAKSQIPVEIFGGNKRTTVDLMFFKFFKKHNGEISRWLFFNRNRASVDYRMTMSSNLPQFGFTEAISYNHEELKGFAPVLVGQLLNSGIFPKAGIQYSRISKNITIFTWLICETMKNPDVDYFLLLRYTPILSDKVKLLAQAESVNTLPTERAGNYNFTQRLRLGIQLNIFQFGVGADFNQTGYITFASIFNTGAFLRYEF